MARLRRQIGINTAAVRLPETTSVGPALVKTATSVANLAFERNADRVTQEAQMAAAALNFERDGDGNLTAPSLPLAENGLLAPSIYDRAYTQMVSTRYLNQMKIDMAKRLNTIATENRFDPKAYDLLGNAYVNKMTELAPDMLKPDVNQSGQVITVEHYNRIIRVTAERDHAEAREVHLNSIQTIRNDLIGYVESDAPQDVINAQMMKLRAAIVEGRDIREGGFSFWNDAEMSDMLDDVEQTYALSRLVASVVNLPDDPVAHAEALQALTDLALGEGSIQMIDEFGEAYISPVAEIWPNPADRIALSAIASDVLRLKGIAFQGVRDARLDRKVIDFFNWFTPHAVHNLPKGIPLDIDRLYDEFLKADADVKSFGFDDTLREAIADIILGTLTGGPNMTQWEEDFIPGWQSWNERFEAEVLRLLDGEPMESYSKEEQREIANAAYDTIGSVPGGHDQTPDGAREIWKYYNGMTGLELDQGFYDDLIDNPNHPRWADLDYFVPGQLAHIGIWQKELSDAIIGRLMDPEGMNTSTLTQTMRLARRFWDSPSFRDNMQDKNALGPQVGGALELIFDNNGMITADNVQKVLESFGRSGYNPHMKYDDMSDLVKAEWEAKAKAYLETKFTNNWWALGIIGMGVKGVEVPRWFEGGYNPLAPQLTGIDGIYQDRIIGKLKLKSGRMDPDNPDAFSPFINDAVNEVMKENGLAPTKIGFSATRYSNYYEWSGWPNTWPREFSRPTWAIVQRPPEWYVAQDKDISKGGVVNRDAMVYVEDNFQKILNDYSEQTWPGEEPHYKAGVNAGLRYSGLNTAPDRLGQPTWEIVLLARNGVDQKILTKQGKWGDVRVLFTLENALKRYREDRQAGRLLGSEASGRIRTYHQEYRPYYTGPRP